MAVSKRLRYEILRRDNHTCRYCGAAAPDATLTIDHVVPVSLGGSDAPSNLVAACADCNAGKTSSMPDAALVSDASADAVRWARAMRHAQQQNSARREEIDWYCVELDAVWNEWHYGPNEEELPRPASWRSSIEQFYDAGLDLDTITAKMRVALANDSVSVKNTWRYFCGCCWTAIRELQDIAYEYLANDDARRKAEADEVPW